METQIYHLENIKEAAQLIKEGKLVAFPTETVYGLGAIANNSMAVQEVFAVKGRPNDNPLIVHVNQIAQVEKYVGHVNNHAKKLMEAFWPGPLTIIFPIKDGIFVPEVTHHQNTVALRMPRQMETLLLIEMVGFPIVGPSANLSGKPSPTQIDHVVHDLSGKISGIVQAKKASTAIGVESTVVLPHENKVMILRPGYITKAMLEDVLEVPVIEKSVQDQLENEEILSPGVKYRHYSPDQPVYLVSHEYSVENWQQFIGQTPGKIGLLANQEILDHFSKKVHASFSLGKVNDSQSATRNLYAGLRYLEQSGCDLILAQGIKDEDQGHAFMNRLKKASSFVL